ncbi:MAG: hypothetical protein ABW252_25970 [Polyangiales bacterium]
MTFFASPSFLSGALAARLALASAALSLASCASPQADAAADDEGDDADDEGDDGSTTSRDASTKPRDAGAPTKAVKDAATPTKPTSTRDSGGAVADSGATQPLIDAGDPLGDLAGAVDWDQIFSSDGGLFTPPGPASPDNPKECPETAPENPIGSCIGVPVYATCKYGNYTCLCDWIHWLCI